MKFFVLPVFTLFFLFSGCGKEVQSEQQKRIHEDNVNALNNIENHLSDQGLTFTSFPEKVVMNHCICDPDLCSSKASEVSRYIYYCHEVYGPDEAMPAEIKTRVQAAGECEFNLRHS